MALTRVELSGVDGGTGSITTASINNIKNSASASNNLVLNSDGTTTLTPSNIIKSGTAQASTSGTAIDFTGIPSWVKRITVMFNGVSTNGTSLILVQIGAGSVTSSGYLSYATVADSAVASTSSTAGYLIYSNQAAAAIYGNMIIASFGGNSWIANGSVGIAASRSSVFGGAIALSGTLDRVRITTVNGTDTFDAGSINILYEG